MTTHPKPSSPLPWMDGEIESDALASENGKGFVVLRRTNDNTIPNQGDWEYLKWAVNNAARLADEVLRLRRTLGLLTHPLQAVADGLDSGQTSEADCKRYIAALAVGAARARTTLLETE